MRSSKTVPLVVYDNGERKVVGEVQVSEDGQNLEMHAVVTDPAIMGKLTTAENGMYSLVADPAVPKEANER